MRRSASAARRLAGLAFLAGLAAGCGHAPAAAPPPLSNHVDGAGVPAAEHTVMATLERTACYGWCPVYTVTVYRDGAVEYLGTNFVKTKGKATGTISADEVAALDRLFTAAHYFDFKDSYESYDMTDQPSATTSYRADGRSKTVRHYYGDSHAPEALSALETGIDRIVRTERWVGTQAERDKLFGPH